VGDPTGEPVVLRRAVAADRAVLLELAEEFCAVDHHPYDAGRVGRALDPLLADDRYGVVWVIDRHGAAGPVGYAVVTWGWSLEAGGKEAVLDELYLRDRGTGAGAVALEAICAATAAAGASRIYLETEAANHRVRRFYARAGFDVEDSIWMGRWLVP
jgi:GNAT superfamily N-acetyltransferase